MTCNHDENDLYFTFGETLQGLPLHSRPAEQTD
jgi:hypothetical protein